jgi:hypothetical protein
MVSGMLPLLPVLLAIAFAAPLVLLRGVGDTWAIFGLSILGFALGMVVTRLLGKRRD